MRVAAAQEQMSLNAALSAGFEIKPTMLVPIDAVKRVDGNASTDAVVVTLQNSNAVAVCLIGLGNWVSMAPTSLDNATLCERR